MAVNLDRFSQGLPDKQDAKVMAECEACGGEIYEGEEVYMVNGEILHADLDCLKSFVNPDLMAIEEALGVI